MKNSLKTVLGKSTVDHELEIKAFRPMNGGGKAATIVTPTETIDRLVKIRSKS